MNPNYDKHVSIRISQYQLDWLDEVVDRDETHETCISTIIRDLIDEKIKWENGMDEEYKARLVEDECQ
jgi:hypothetical protein